MDEDRLSGRIKIATQSTSELVNSLGSFKHIIHTLFLIGGGVSIGLLGWAGYKYVDAYVRPPINIDNKELLAKSTDGFCSFYKRGEGNYLVEYFKGFDNAIEGNIYVMAKFSTYPRNVGKTCSLLKGSKIPTPMQTAKPDPVDHNSIQIIN